VLINRPRVRWLNMLFLKAHAVGMDADWRKDENRLHHWGLMAYIMSNTALNPIWKIPYIQARVFRIDWLHCADMGCSADYVGNMLWLLKDKFPGRDQKAKVQELWLRTSQ
jgi:hypothetical protein